MLTHRYVAELLLSGETLLGSPTYANADSLGEDSFMKEAAKITNPATQDLILRTIYELTVQNGAPEDSQKGIFMKLTRLWQKQ